MKRSELKIRYTALLAYIFFQGIKKELFFATLENFSDTCNKFQKLKVMCDGLKRIFFSISWIGTLNANGIRLWKFFY